MDHLKRGFLTIAYGNRHYLRMAESLILSFRRFNAESSFAVVTDNPNSKFLKEFDKIIPLRGEYGSGLAQKLHVDLYTPYDETIFIDSDGLFYKSPEYLWNLYSHYDEFAIRGFRYREIRDGVPGLKAADETFKMLSIDRVPFINSGIFYFRKGERQKNLFNISRKIAKRSAELGLLPFGGHKFNDENVLALAIEVCGIEMLPWERGVAMDMYSNVDEESLNILTPCAKFSTYGRHVDPIFVHYCAGAQYSSTYNRETIRIKAISHQWPTLITERVHLIEPAVTLLRHAERKLWKARRKFFC